MTSGPDQRRKIGDYEVLAKLKKGGMGQVLLGRRVGAHGFERLVAIKTLRADVAGRETLRALFSDEARLTARLTHPAITQVYDFGEDGDELYLVMEYVAGITFRELALRRPPPLVGAQAMTQVCRGLHAAHELADRSGKPLGVVHRDISPQNLVMTFHGGVKILDFGIALTKGRLAPVTEVGRIRGKPAYMSPEQVTNAPIDRRTDIFAVGLCLHELLTGNRVFRADSIQDLFNLIEKARIRPPSREAGRLPAGLDKAVLRALERDPEKRFPTALEMARALDVVVSGAGGGQDTLESYARLELAPDSEKHRVTIEEVLGGGVHPDDGEGRPDGLITEPRFPDTTVATGQRTRSTSLRIWLAAMALLILVGIGTFWYLTAYHTPEPDGDAGVVPPVEGPSRQPEIRSSVDPPSDPPPVAPEKVPAQKPAGPRKHEKKPGSRPRRPGARRRKAVKPREPAPPPESVPQSKEFGSITVGVNPYALVRIDGREVGVTPIIRHKLLIGDHEVVLVNPKSGKVLHRRIVTIVKGKHHEVIID